MGLTAAASNWCRHNEGGRMGKRGRSWLAISVCVCVCVLFCWNCNNCLLTTMDLNCYRLQLWNNYECSVSESCESNESSVIEFCTHEQQFSHTIYIYIHGCFAKVHLSPISANINSCNWGIIRKIQFCNARNAEWNNCCGWKVTEFYRDSARSINISLSWKVL